MSPDLIVMDIMLSELDSLEVARILRKEISTPILMLTTLHGPPYLVASVLQSFFNYCVVTLLQFRNTWVCKHLARKTAQICIALCVRGQVE